MKKLIAKLNAEYIIDKNGKRTKIILTLDSFEKLINAFEDIYLGSLAIDALRNNDEFIDYHALKKELLK